MLTTVGKIFLVVRFSDRLKRRKKYSNTLPSGNLNQCCTKNMAAAGNMSVMKKEGGNCKLKLEIINNGIARIKISF